MPALRQKRDIPGKKNFAPCESSDQSVTLTDLGRWYQNAIDS